MSHAFVCLPSLESRTFEQQVCLAKKGYANAVLLGKIAAKKECEHFRQRKSSKKSRATLTVVGLNKNTALYIASSKFSERKRFVRRLNKIEGKHIQEQQLNQFHCFNKSRVFFERIEQSVSKYNIGIWMKNGCGPRLLICPMFRCWMLLFRMHGCCITLTKMKSMSLCLS